MRTNLPDFGVRGWTKFEGGAFERYKLPFARPPPHALLLFFLVSYETYTFLVGRFRCAEKKFRSGLREKDSYELPFEKDFF